MSVIRGSVGRGGRNDKSDVRVVQRLLNRHLPANQPLLEVDGIVGPKTLGALHYFQSKVLKMHRPDDRADLGGVTFRALCAPSKPPQPALGGAPLPTGLPPGFVQNETALREELASTGDDDLWPEFRQAVEDTTKGWKQLFFLLKRAEDVRKAVHLWRVFRLAGFSSGETAQILRSFYGLIPENPEFTQDLLRYFAKAKGPHALFWKSISKAGDAVKFLDFLVKYHSHWSRGDYHMAFVEIYKTWMGKAVGFAGILDSVESFSASVADDETKNSRFFKFLRAAMNPIGHGANAVDAMGVLVHCAVTRDMDAARFRRLEERVRNSPGQVFVEIGDDLADALDQIINMSDQEFSSLMSVTNVTNWLRYLATGDLPAQN